MKRIFKWIGAFFLLMFLIGKTTGCMQFRDSPKKIKKKFSKAGYEYQLRTIKSETRNLHYLRTSFGDSSKPVVVFVHGSPGSLNNFYDNLFDSALQANFEMYSVDRPGFGYSDFGNSMPDLKAQAQFVSVLLDFIGDRKVILVGHSYGGPVIGQIAVDFPDFVNALLIVAGSIDPELEPEEWWRKPMNSTVGRFFTPKSFVVSNQEILVLKKDLIDLKPRWSEIQMPVIVLQGEKDFLVPAGNADFAKEKITNADSLDIRMFPDVNHFIPFKQAELISKALMDLKKQID